MKKSNQAQVCAQVQPEQRDQTGHQNSCAFNTELRQLIPVIVGYFFRSTTQAKDCIGSGVVELSLGSALLEHRGQLLSLSTSLVTYGTQG